MRGWECHGECGMIQKVDDDYLPEICENCNGPVEPVTITDGWTE